MAGRTVAMTAIFTPGYAATEQMTSAKQGPWTDIYGLAATLYHAIAGKTPPSAFDRMLDDGYEPLARLAPKRCPTGPLAGIDAGLAKAVRMETLEAGIVEPDVGRIGERGRGLICACPYAYS